MHYLHEVFTILKKASAFGECTTSSGATLLGRTPHVGPDAWLHTLYPPIAEDEINLIEEEIRVRIPNSLRELLELTNGINVFCDSLSIFGRRGSYRRDTDAREPYSIVSVNLYDRPSRLGREKLLIGSYRCRDGFWVYMDTRSQKVFRCGRTNPAPQMEWSDLGEMLLSEVRRLDQLFDDRGIVIDKHTPIVPEA